MTEQPVIYDPYRNCERVCTHDTANGMLIDDITHDGPDGDFADAWLSGEALSVVAQRVRDWQAQT